MRTTQKGRILVSFSLIAVLSVAGWGYTAPLYFPHADTTNGWQTEIAIINTSPDQSVVGTLRALSGAGQLVEAKPVTLPGRGRLQIAVANAFVDHTRIRYLVLDSDSSAMQGYTKFYRQGQYGEHRVAVPAIKDVNASDIYVTHIDSSAQWWTGLSVVNTTGDVKNITISFSDGQVRNIALAANEHRAFAIRELFNGQPQPSIQSAVITHASGVIGLELFATNDGKQMEGILLTDKTAYTVYYPHVSSDGWWTGIVAYNPSASDCAITVTPYDANGTALTPSLISLAGKKKYVGAVHRELPLPVQTAWCRIESTQPLSGFELIGTNDGEQLAGHVDVGGLGAKQGMFPKIGKFELTSIALVNTESSPASVVLTAYDDNGAPGATQTLTVGPHAKAMNSAAGFFSQSIANATYIVYTADRNMVGLQLNGSVDGKMLDGLPALGLTGDWSTGGGTNEVYTCLDGTQCTSPLTCSPVSECVCPAGQQLCVHGCIPANASCCPDGSYCESPAICASDGSCTSDGSIPGMNRHIFANDCVDGMVYGYTGPNYTICNMMLNTASALCRKIFNYCHGYF